MPKSDNLQYLIDTNRAALKRLLDDVSEEESLQRGNDNLLHIRWQTGHLVHSMGSMVRVLGQAYEHPEGYEKLFAAGSEISDDPSIYPNFAALRQQLYDLHDQAHIAAGRLSDPDLDRDLPRPSGQKMKVMDAAQFLCMHTFYHAGQITVIRRILGRERPFA